MKTVHFISGLIGFLSLVLVACLFIFVPNFAFAFLGSLAGVAILFLSIGLTIAIYLYIDNHKRRMSDAMYRFLYFVILFVIGFSIRLACVLYVVGGNITDFWSAVARGIQTLYFSIAGIGFEGQDISVGEIADRLIPAIIYFVSMLWLAASYIIVISAGVSYGVYSFFLKIFYCRFGRRSEYYIFTTVTEDAINLADTIREKKGESAFILFASNSLEKFDPSNELHQLIKQRKYPYLVLPRRQFMEESPKPVVGRRFGKIGLISRSRHNSAIVDTGLLSKRRLKNCSFHVFALEVDKEEKGLESANSDTVYDDIQGNIYDVRFYNKVIKEYLISDKDNPYFHIDYYVLTHNSINYEFYSKNFRRIYKNYEIDMHDSAMKYQKEYESSLSEQDKKDLEGIINNVTNEKLMKLFKVNIINEAYLAGITLLERRRELEVERIKKYGEINATNNENNDHVAIILGFGQTGQWALQNLYVDTVNVKRGTDDNSTGEQSRFIAHVYDEKILNYAGQFEKNHPSFLIAKVDDNYDKDILTFLDKNEKIDKGNINEFNALIKEYKEKAKVNFVNIESIKKFYEGYDFEEVDKYMKFPHIYFHAKNCNSLSLLNDIDNAVGTLTKAPTAWRKANSIVIALGNDESNIMTANAILQDIRQELYSSYDKEKEKNNYVDIYVNIRNDKNRHRLNWNTELENILHPNIRVKTFGNSDKMFSFDMVINNLKITRLNSNYGLTSSNADNFEFMRDKDVTCTLANCGEKYQETMHILDELMIIEGFMKCVTSTDFKQYHDEFINAYVNLGMRMYGSVNEKEFINKAFKRKYSKFEEIVEEKSRVNMRGKWKPSKVNRDDMESHLRVFANEMSFDDYVSIIVPLVSLGLLQDTTFGSGEEKFAGQYLINLDTFKSYFPQVYGIISERKMNDIAKNRKAIITSRYKDKEFNADMIFLDIANTLRSFYLDHYSTDSTRYLLGFLGYYAAYFNRKDKNGKPVDYKDIELDYLERNYLGQFEHARWSRYMFSRGTILASNIDNPTNFEGILDNSPICENTNYDDKTYTKQFIKLHKDLVPYLIHKHEYPGAYLADYLEIYDYINALLAPFFEKEEEMI